MAVDVVVATKHVLDTILEASGMGLDRVTKRRGEGGKSGEKNTCLFSVDAHFLLSFRLHVTPQ